MDRPVLPRIDPVPDHVRRPLWSVMITTYNRVEFLAATLKGVLDQAPGRETMQIEVVDNSSTGAVENFVRQIAGPRIHVQRFQARMSLSAAMTLCLQRAQGHYVHVLHDDDAVRPGFYAKLQDGLAQDARIGAAFCRHVFIDERDREVKVSHQERGSAGVLDGWLEQLAISNRIQMPSIVVKRAAYETLGGFCGALRHTADWEMWRRIASRYAFWYEPEVLAMYRVHPGSDTSQLQRSGGDIADVRKSLAIARHYLPAEKQAEWSSKARAYWAQFAVKTARQMLARGDYPAAANQILQALRTDPASLKPALRLLKAHFTAAHHSKSEEK